MAHAPRVHLSDDGINNAMHHPVTAKRLTVWWAQGHRDPNKAHNVQDRHDYVGNKVPGGGHAATTMHPTRGSRCSANDK